MLPLSHLPSLLSSDRQASSPPLFALDSLPSVPSLQDFPFFSTFIGFETTDLESGSGK